MIVHDKYVSTYGGPKSSFTNKLYHRTPTTNRLEVELDAAVNGTDAFVH